MEVPGTAAPTTDVTEDPPTLSVFVMPRVAWAESVSVSVAVTVPASEAEADALFT
jgi:hypothetical protein